MIIADSFMSAHSIGCAGACGECCGGIAGKPGPEEPKGPCMPDVSCNNKGLIFGLHTGKAGVGGDRAPPNANFVDGDVPAYLGSTSKLGSPGVNRIYGHPNAIENSVIEHRGYFFAQEGGEYTFEAGIANDYILVW